MIASPVLVVLVAVVGCAGGIYGIGGGSILAPVLIGSGRPPADVAPAALAFEPLLPPVHERHVGEQRQ